MPRVRGKDLFCCRNAGWSNARLLGWPGSAGLARDYERLPQTVAGLTFLAFTCLMLSQVIR